MSIIIMKVKNSMMFFSIICHELLTYNTFLYSGASDPGGSGGVGPPLESGIYVVKNFLKIFLIYSDPPWIKIVPWPLIISQDKQILYSFF